MYNPSTTSYGDNVCLDVSFGFNFGILKLLRWTIINLYPINKIFKARQRDHNGCEEKLHLNKNYRLHI